MLHIPHLSCDLILHISHISVGLVLHVLDLSFMFVGNRILLCSQVNGTENGNSRNARARCQYLTSLFHPVLVLRKKHLSRDEAG